MGYIRNIKKRTIAGSKNHKMVDLSFNLLNIFFDDSILTSFFSAVIVFIKTFSFGFKMGIGCSTQSPYILILTGFNHTLRQQHLQLLVHILQVSGYLQIYPGQNHLQQSRLLQSLPGHNTAGSILLLLYLLQQV